MGVRELARAAMLLRDLADENLAATNIHGPVAQLVRAGDSSKKVRLRRKTQNERDEFRETLTARLMATLSQAGSTLSEGAETT
jgi:hypothetical protein